MLESFRQRGFAARFALVCALALFLAQALATQHAHLSEPAGAAHCALCVSAGSAAATPPCAPPIAVPRTAYVSSSQPAAVHFTTAPQRSPSAARAPPAGQ